jgi:hypothetical protein
VRADLWADILTDDLVRARFSATIDRRRVRLRGWIEEGVAAGDLADIPANAGASILLALSDGLLLHAGLDPAAFRWANIRRVLDILLAPQSTPAAEATLPPVTDRQGDAPASLTADVARMGGEPTL